MRNFVLFVMCLALFYCSPKAEADIRALAAVPNPVAGASVLPGYHIGEYTASTEVETGDFTLEGKSIYASTSSRSKITISSGAFAFESGGGSSTIKTSSPMEDDYSFSIN